MSSAERTVQQHQERRPIDDDFRQIMSATVTEVESGVIWVTCDYKDNGLHSYGPILTSGSYSIGDEVLIGEDELGRFWLLGAGSKSGTFARTIGDGHTTSFVVQHNLGSQDVTVQVREAAGSFQYIHDWVVSGLTVVENWSVEATDENNVTLAFHSAPGVNAYRVIVRA